MQVEFVDRYTDDPRGRPTAFNACRGGCQAMGFYPTQEPQPGEEPDEDGWWWVTCEACDGTGRVPLWRGLLRVPLWLIKGARFMWHTNKTRDMHPAGWSRWHILRVTFGIAFLADLGLYRP